MWHATSLRRLMAVIVAVVLVVLALGGGLGGRSVGAAPSVAPHPDQSRGTPTPRTIFGAGYDLVGSDGGVFVFPTANGSIPVGGNFFGSLPGLGVHVDDIVGMVPTLESPSVPGLAQGYDLVGSDGGVFVFPVGQPAGFYGSLPGLGVHVDDIVGMVPTSNDTGYFLVGADGGVFSFDAPFENSLPGKGIHVDDIVGIAPTGDDKGYWLVSATGTVYPLGDAAAYGDLGGASSSPIVGIAATSDSKGYWMVSRNGTVSAFGDAASFGGLPTIGLTLDDIVSIVPTSYPGPGYLLIGANGGVYTFGAATFAGSIPGLGLPVGNIVGAVPTMWLQP